jgi:glycosyltransferase involved in cell wall biosynthesis
MSNIAMFTTYAPSEGFGGPARAFHQRRVLESAGHTVTHVVVQAVSERGDCRRSDLVELSERPFRAPYDPIYADVDLGVRAAADRALVDRVVDHLVWASVDLIILEQPFLVDLVRLVIDQLSIPVIYSCQNIEYRLRKDLERFSPDPKRSSDRSEQVRRLEATAVEMSSHVTAICPTDQEHLRDDFDCESTLVPNGTSVSEIALTARPASTEPYFSFAGSSYWPNVEGFTQIANPSLAFLPPTMRIQIAGTVGTETMKHPAILRHQSANASRITLRGFLPMDDLVRMMSRSLAVLVPVFVGEGSNLKSADALASGAPVIMTKRATRGYEDVIDADGDGVTVVRSAAEFRTAMENAVHAPRSSDPIGERRHELLSWVSRLATLNPSLAAVTNGAGPR